MKKLLFFTLSMFLFIFFSLNVGIYAGTTGKIQGTVLDAESNEPLPGVNVVLEGTTFGAAADENGFFFIINVPPGTYRLKATMVGYAVETQENVRVYVDRTTPVNFSLKTEAVAGEEVTVTAARVPVPLDVSATEAYVSGEDIVESAEGRFDELMGYQAGVELSSDVKEGEGFSVRGGSIYETDVQIDGISMTNEFSKVPTLAISRNLIQDVQILTGGFNAEYGNIRSGLINVVTKEGSYNRYSGVLEGIYSPAATKHHGDFGPFDARDRANEYLGGTGWNDYGLEGMSSDALNGWGEKKTYRHNDYVIAYESGGASAGDKYIKEHPYTNTFEGGWDKLGETQGGYTGITSAEIYRWVHRPKEYGGNPDLTLDVGGGGPVPFIPRTKFYTSHYWNKSMYAIPTNREFSTELTSTGKLTQRIKSNMILTANFIYNRVAALGSDAQNDNPSFGYVVGDRTENSGYLRNPYNESQNFPRYNKNYFGSLKFTHTYSPSTYWDMEVGVQRGFIDLEPMRARNTAKIKFIDDPLLAAADWYETNTVTGKSYGYPAGRIGIDEAPRGFFLDTPAQTRVSNSMVSTDDQFGRRIAGIQYQWIHINNTTINIKGNVVSQVNKFNQIKAGFEFNNFHINSRYYRDNGAWIYRDETKYPTAFRVYKADPRELEAYVQDKLEWEGMIVNFGLRATYWDPNTKAYDMNGNNMFSEVWSAGTWGNVIGEGNWKFRNQRTRKIKGRILLQPRVGVSHPITESSKIFFNYGHFYQRPYYDSMYLTAPEIYYSGGRARVQVPVADQTWPRTVSYEIGYSQSIYDQILLQISGYYKDYTNERSNLFVESYYADISYLTYANNRYRDVRGLEFRIERSFGRFLNFWGNYNYMIQSEGNTGLNRIYEDQLKEEDQWFWFGQERAETRPTFRLSVTLRTPVGFGPGPSILGIKPLAEWRMNWLVSWRDGGEFVDNRTLAPRDWKYIQRINYQMYELYITKQIARGANFYIRVNNIFNIKYFQPGRGYTESLRFPWTSPKGDDKYGDYDKYWIDTYSAGEDWQKWRWNKRDVYFGIRYQF